MTINLAAAARVVPFTALLLAACVSQSAYEQQSQELEQARAQAAAQQAEIAKMQREQKWTVAGDILFPEGGYQLSADGKQALDQYVPRLERHAARPGAKPPHRDRARRPRRLMPTSAQHLSGSIPAARLGD